MVRGGEILTILLIPSGIDAGMNGLIHPTQRDSQKCSAKSVGALEP